MLEQDKEQRARKSARVTNRGEHSSAFNLICHCILLHSAATKKAMVKERVKTMLLLCCN